MIRKLYDWTMGLAARPRALHALGGVSFAESSFFPVPPDVLLIPMVLARPERAYTIAMVCTVTSVLGGILGYAIGYYLYATVGQAVIDFYGLQETAIRFQQWYRDFGLWVILAKGLTPIPYKIVTIMSGAASFDIGVFIAASVLTRGLRFFIVAGLLRQFGEPIREFIEKRLTLLFFLFLIFLIGGFVALKYI
ncbi:MAG: YqaA family protein [Rhodospirillaceae bacterium]